MSTATMFPAAAGSADADACMSAKAWIVAESKSARNPPFVAAGFPLASSSAAGPVKCSCRAWALLT
jgi:hypothetical protein